MYITQSYKYEYNGIVYVSANVPEGATIIETMDILNAEDGYILIRKSDGEDMGNSVWLHDGDVMDNYTERKDDTDIDSQLGAVVVGYFIFSNKSYKNENTSLKTEITDFKQQVSDLQLAVNVMKDTIETYAKADEQAKEFEKELINDKNVDNLDAVPDEYILKQLHAD